MSMCGMDFSISHLFSWISGLKTAFQMRPWMQKWNFTHYDSPQEIKTRFSYVVS